MFVALVSLVDISQILYIATEQSEQYIHKLFRCVVF